MAEDISGNYRQLTAAELEIFGVDYDRAWLDPSMPERQYRRVVASELEVLRRGDEVLPYRVLLDCLAKLTPMPNPTLLDVGASTGYYSEVLKIGKFECQYTGMDYSPDMKRVADKLFPGIRFDVGDARALPYADASFDIVLHGACLMHVREWQTAVLEATRVSKGYVIFHRTSINDKRPTAAYAKECYGIPAMEWRISTGELLDTFGGAGLRIIHQVDLFLDQEGYGHRTYVTERL